MLLEIPAFAWYPFLEDVLRALFSKRLHPSANSCCVGNSYVGGGPDSTPALQHRGLLLVMGATATMRKPDRCLRIQDEGQVAETSQAAARARHHPGVLACASIFDKESLRSTLRPYNLKDRLLGTGADVSETIKGLRRDEGYIVHTFSTALPGVGALRNTCSISTDCSLLCCGPEGQKMQKMAWQRRRKQELYHVSEHRFHLTLTRSRLILLGIMRGTHHFHRSGVGHRR